MAWGLSIGRASVAMAQVASPNRETFHIGMARHAYLEGRIDIEAFERSVEHVLGGGTLDQDGQVPRPKELVAVELEGPPGCDPVTLHTWREVKQAQG